MDLTVVVQYYMQSFFVVKRQDAREVPGVVPGLIMSQSTTDKIVAIDSFLEVEDLLHLRRRFLVG